MSRKMYGDLLAQEVADWIHEPVATTTALTAISADDRPDKMIVAIASTVPSIAIYKLGSTSTVDSATIFVPDDIAASAAYLAVPSSAPGRWHVMAAQLGNTGPQEFVNCAAASATGLRAAAATVATTSTATLLAGGITELNKAPRQIVFTTAGVTASDAPATALISGYDAQGNAQTETVTLAQTATTATSSKFFSGTGLVITFAAGDGTGATIAIGWGAKLGFLWKVKDRQGGVIVLGEWSGGTKVTNGTFVKAATDAPFGSYTPNASLDGATDFVILAERDLS